MAGSERTRDGTYYDRLGVSRSASGDEIAAAYRASVLLYHPDVSLAPDAEATMVKLNEAFAVLRDPHRRQEYDFSLGTPASRAAVEERTHDDETFVPRRRVKKPIYGMDDFWANRTIPGFARDEHLRQATARELQAYWRSQTEAAPLNFFEKIGVLLVVPVFVAVVFLLIRLLK